MGRAPCCSKVGLHRGPWTPREDTLLSKYVEAHGEGHWRALPKKAGLLRCGKSCRLRWMNYLRPDIKRGNITPDEDDLIIRLHSLLGNRWSLIAGRLPGRTDNEIKNYWNTHLGKKLMSEGTDPNTHQKLSQPPAPKENKRKKKQNHRAKNKNKNKNKNSTGHRIVPEKPKVHLPKPTRVTSFVNLPRNDSLTTASTVSSSQDHVDNIIPWSDFKEGGVVCSVGDGSSSDFECYQSRVIPNIVAAGEDDGHTLENIYEEYLQALLKTTDQDQNYQVELDSFAESLLI